MLDQKQFLYSFKELGGFSLDELADFFKKVTFGKKAEHLIILKNAGFPVPDAFFIEPKTPLDFAANSSFFKDQVEKLSSELFSVRSSSPFEDSDSASYAGLFDSFLNVKSSDLMKSIKEVQKSGQSDRVKAYTATIKGIFSNELIPVIIQKMIRPKISGVLFTMHPIEGKEEVALIEYCEGTGDKLVSGTINPYRLSLDWESGEVTTEGFSENHIPTQLWKELMNYGRKASALFNYPQDIEWAIDEEDKIWILQSRAITKIIWRNDLEEFTNADLKDGGISSSVCTPMMYSLYERVFQYSMQQYFVDMDLLSFDDVPIWMKKVYGRGYWNAGAVKKILTKIPGFNEKRFDLDLGIQKEYPKDNKKKSFEVFTLLNLLLSSLKIKREYKNHYQYTTHFLNKIFSRKEQLFRSILVHSKSSTFSILKTSFLEIFNFQKSTESLYFRTIYNNSNLQSDFKSFLSSTLSPSVVIDYTKLFEKIEGIPHLEVSTQINKLKDIAKADGFKSNTYRIALSDFYKRYDFHSDKELDISKPFWGEMPHRITQMIQDFIQVESEDHSAILKSRSEENKDRYEVECKRIINQLRLKRTFFSRPDEKFIKDLKHVRNYLRRREEMRNLSTKMYYFVRLSLLSVGQYLVESFILNHSDEIFYFTIEEVILGLSHLSEDEILEYFKNIYREKIKLRESSYLSLKKLVPPNELGFGVVLRKESSWEAQSDGLHILKGLGCSSGIVKARAKVVLDLKDAALLKSGDILVTQYTDPGWTSILGRVSGVITEVGGLLSHAAVIGRELSVPVILNLPDATRLIKNDSLIEMDGSTGVIRLFKED